MKKTLITIALTTVVVLTLIGIVSSQVFSSRSTGLQAIGNALPGGFGGGGGQPELYAESPASAPEEFVVSKELMVSQDLMVNFPMSNPAAADVNRLVIKNADLAIVVKDPKADMARINKLASELGGYVVASNLYQSYYGPNSVEVPEASITIRVPSGKLDEVLEKIKENAVDVDYENVTGVDVTSEYVDLQSRLTAKQAAEKKLLQILDKAEKSEDVLAIYMQIQNVQTEIESLKGQIKYYEESAQLSAVSVRLIAEAGTQPIAVGPWKPTGSAKEAVQDLIYFFQNFVDFLIRFVVFNLPALILIGIPLYIVFIIGRRVFRRVNKSKVVAEEQEEAKK